MISASLREQIERALDSADDHRMKVSEWLTADDPAWAVAAVDLAIGELERAKELISGGG